MNTNECLMVTAISMLVQKGDDSDDRAVFPGIKAPMA